MFLFPVGSSFGGIFRAYPDGPYPYGTRRLNCSLFTRLTQTSFVLVFFCLFVFGREETVKWKTIVGEMLGDFSLAWRLMDVPGCFFWGGGCCFFFVLYRFHKVRFGHEMAGESV